MEKRGGRSRQELLSSSQRVEPPQKSRFAYLGTSEVQTPPEPLTLEEQLWNLYGTTDSAVVSDGTLQHQLAEIIKQNGGRK